MKRSSLGIAANIAGVVIIGFFSYSAWSDNATTFIIVRHAERLDASANTNLSEVGLARAEALINAASEAGVGAIYSTNFCRTLQTVQPLASHLSLSINVQHLSASTDLNDCDPAISVAMNDLPASVNNEMSLVEHVLDKHNGKTVLIVGHSNTVPALVAALGGAAFDPVVIDHDEFNHLFIVRKNKRSGPPTLIKTKYGA